MQWLYYINKASFNIICSLLQFMLREARIMNKGGKPLSTAYILLRTDKRITLGMTLTE